MIWVMLGNGSSCGFDVVCPDPQSPLSRKVKVLSGSDVEVVAGRLSILLLKVSMMDLRDIGEIFDLEESYCIGFETFVTSLTRM